MSDLLSQTPSEYLINLLLPSLPLAYDEKNQRIPVDVHARAYIYFIQNLEAHDLQFKIHALIQFRFVDPRLVFREVAPSRTAPIMGEASLRDSIWVPHVFLSNERSSSIMGTMEKDILTSISPDGTVIVSSRVQAQLYCWMNLRKFPFDEQTCKTTLESCKLNFSQLCVRAWSLVIFHLSFLFQGCTTLVN